jgi:hypothetical protein
MLAEGGDNTKQSHSNLSNKRRRQDQKRHKNKGCTETTTTIDAQRQRQKDKDNKVTHTMVSKIRKTRKDASTCKGKKKTKTRTTKTKHDILVLSSVIALQLQKQDARRSKTFLSCLIVCDCNETTSFGDDKIHETSFGDEKTSFKDESSYTIPKIDLHVSKVGGGPALLPFPCAGSVTSGARWKMLRGGVLLGNSILVVVVVLPAVVGVWVFMRKLFERPFLLLLLS